MNILLLGAAGQVGTEGICSVQRPAALKVNW